jgi:regulator of protease activity HflC (stomatin/prohibitin superfamily)
MTYLIGIVGFFVVLTIFKMAVIVPQQSAYVIEFFGKYSRTLGAGFTLLIPWADRIAYRYSLKEEAIDIPEQVCITSDNVQVSVDGVLYLRVLDPERASYGIGNYLFAVTQLTQTTLRSEIGKLELDKTFEARNHINANVVSEVDKATEAWGVKVLRYEIKNIIPPHDVVSAMEKQMRAEREKRAQILTSEGERDSKINQAEGEKQRVIKESEAIFQKQVNEAKGEAEAILSVAKATAEGIRIIGDAISAQGGSEAMQLRIAENYIQQFGKIAQKGNTIVLPANLSDVGSMITMARGLLTKEPSSEQASKGTGLKL